MHGNNGGAENNGHKNDGPSKLQSMKLQDMKVAYIYRLTARLLTSSLAVFHAAIWVKSTNLINHV